MIAIVTCHGDFLSARHLERDMAPFTKLCHWPVYHMQGTGPWWRRWEDRKTKDNPGIYSLIRQRELIQQEHETLDVDLVMVGYSRGANFVACVAAPWILCYVIYEGAVMVDHCPSPATPCIQIWNDEGIRFRSERTKRLANASAAKWSDRGRPYEEVRAIGPHSTWLPPAHGWDQREQFNSDLVSSIENLVI